MFNYYRIAILGGLLGLIGVIGNDTGAALFGLGVCVLGEIAANKSRQ